MVILINRQISKQNRNLLKFCKKFLYNIFENQGDKSIKGTADKSEIPHLYI